MRATTKAREVYVVENVAPSSVTPWPSLERDLLSQPLDPACSRKSINDELDIDFRCPRGPSHLPRSEGLGDGSRCDCYKFGGR